jgi:predicted NBD/HSP70 family sugar kinase
MRVLGDLISACRTLSVASGALLGIGVAVPCPVDALSPDHMSPRLMPAWTQVRLAEQLFQRHGVRVFVDNDANCGAMAEALFGAGRDVPVFTYIKVATGCGAGHIVGRRPYRGISGSAGEIGHTTVDPNGRPCRCGLRGCLEAEIGSAALIEQTQRALDAGQSSSLAEVSPLTLADIVRAANDGDIVACEIVAEAGRHLAVGVANLLNLLNPARVIIGGRLAETGDALLAPLRRAVHDRALWTSVERADIVASAMGRDVVAIGAASLVVQAGLDDLELFRTPTNAEAA